MFSLATMTPLEWLFLLLPFVMVEMMMIELIWKNVVSSGSYSHTAFYEIIKKFEYMYLHGRQMPPVWLLHIHTLCEYSFFSHFPFWQRQRYKTNDYNNKTVTQGGFVCFSSMTAICPYTVSLIILMTFRKCHFTCLMLSFWYCCCCCCIFRQSW